MEQEFPVVVVGAGAGGLVIAIGCARAGKKVLLIERGHWGGDCTNFGCIPSKTLIGAAERGEEGKKALSLVHKIVSDVRSHEEPAILEKMGMKTLNATASFLSPNLIEAREPNGKVHQIRAKKIVIAAGSSPFIPPIAGLKGTPFLTNETIFSLETAPSSLIVLGGGPIGCELAQAFQRLGSKVKLVESHDKLLVREPKEAGEVILEQFNKEGMEVHLGSHVEKVEYREKSFLLTFSSGKKIEGEQLLVSVGRKPSLEELHLEKGGIHYTNQGIVVDSYGRTNQKHIFAVGDSVGAPFFTHLAENRARAVLTTLLLPSFLKKKIDLKQPIPRVTFTDPEVASVGLSEEEAIEQYGAKRIAIYFVPMKEVDRAITQERTEGFVKVVTKRWSSQILGATIVCPRAGEMLQEITLAIYAKIPLRKLASIIHPYPTYSLAIRKAADRWLTQTIIPFLRGLNRCSK